MGVRQLENMAHGSADMGFAFEAYRPEIVLNIEHVGTFARALRSMTTDKGLSGFVDATTGGIYSDSAARWLHSSRVSRDIYGGAFECLRKRIGDSKKVHRQTLSRISKRSKYGKTLCANVPPEGRA